MNHSTSNNALDALIPSIIGRPRGEFREAKIMETYAAQLGEMAWHAVHIDDKIDDVSVLHSNVMQGLVSRYDLNQPDKELRILEVGAYAHYSVHLAAAGLNAVGVATDISPDSLRAAGERAREKGISIGHTLFAADFHDLPFNSGYFDLVFVASSVHHTFRPWVMLQELFRVTRPGGIVHLENEPVGSEFCFYQYRGNRDYELTPFETAVKSRGLHRRLNSPYGGSRSEELFGIIENDRIPLHIYLDTFASNGSADVLSYDFATTVGEFEETILALPRDTELATKIAGLLENNFAELAKVLSMRDVLMGFGVPRREQIWHVAYKVASRLKTLPAPSDKDYQNSERLPLVTATQFEVGRSPGEIENGVRYEDITQLSFADAQFDCTICSEILEHIPDYKAALREMARTLKKGGKALLTFPWRGRDIYETSVRAILRPDGTIDHLLPPQYHGDPAKEEGILSFRDFGWQILDEMRECGFSKATADYIFGPVHGYMTVLNPVIVGIK